MKRRGFLKSMAALVAAPAGVCMGVGAAKDEPWQYEPLEGWTMDSFKTSTPYALPKDAWTDENGHIWMYDNEMYDMTNGKAVKTEDFLKKDD